MHSARPDGTRGAFDVQAITFYRPLTLALPALPPDAHLALRARTFASPAPARVALSPSYEGTFALAAGDAALRVGRTAEDPKGLGRRRVVRIEPGQSRGAFNGSVVWGEGEKAEERGSVSVEAEKGEKVSLDLGGAGQ